MDIHVFTDKKNTGNIFSAVEKGRTYQVSYYGVKDFKKTYPKLQNRSLCYIDLYHLDDKEQDKLLSSLRRIRSVYYGIIDPRNKVTDVGDLFHSGAVDYIGRDVCREGISLQRAKKIDRIISEKEAIADSLTEELPASSQSCDAAHNYISSGRNWKNIKNNQEYTFLMMYVELDDQSEFQNKSSKSHTSSIINSFKAYLEQFFAPMQGKIWMWKDFGGLLLFPFDGKNVEAVIQALRFLLSRRIAAVEHFGLSKLLSYRIAFHIGNTKYRSSGTTGNIVSDSINSIFHLGKKSNDRGELCITEEVYHFLPEGIKFLFVVKGSYEGRKILRMRLPK
jgi:hypothetical protein